MGSVTVRRWPAISVIAIALALMLPALPAFAQYDRSNNSCVQYSGSSNSCETVFWSYEEGSASNEACATYSGSNRSCDAPVFSVPTEGYDYASNYRDAPVTAPTSNFAAPYGSGMSPQSGNSWGGYGSPYGMAPGGYRAPLSSYGSYPGSGTPYGGYNGPVAPYGSYQGPVAPYGGYNMPAMYRQGY